MRLIDRLLHSDIDAEFKQALRSAVCVVIDNVTSYYYESNDQEYWEIGRDFPNVAPPFPDFWMETRSPRFINSQENGLKPWPERDFQAWGALFHAEEMEGIPAIPPGLVRSKLTSIEVKERVEKEIAGLLARHGLDPQRRPSQEEFMRIWASFDKAEQTLLQNYVARSRLIERDDVEAENNKLVASLDAKWVVDAAFVPYVGAATKFAVMPLSFRRMFVKADGTVPNILPDRVAWADWANHDEKLGSVRAIQLCEELASFYFPFYLAISFMHCRNVAMQQSTPSERESRRSERGCGLPLVKYYVLNIDHLQRTLQTEGHAGSTGLKRALHICRGHFAHYTEERKLFGRLAGDFWIPMHARGNADRGIVNKSYRVK